MLPKYHSFLLRTWQAGLADHPTWRASLENPHTHELIGFDSLEALCAYLKSLELQTSNPPSEPIHTQHQSLAE
jgi:hypothetical protein